ncbi:MAG TPA: FtsW/RodA/SpoVE family cell cycle protein, partial [Bacteroidales bacterium]|nr:FtsW/RodA/SpoVE family cell cycle protein [Bacteroidales bacterium]
MVRILGHIRGDKVIWAVVILLSIFSLLAVYSSTGTLAYKEQGGNTEYYMLKHLIILIGGLVIMYLTHLVKFTYFSRIFQIALYIAVPLLVLTLFVGLNLNEAKRVLPLPFGFTFQTSDLAKLTLIMYLARLLSKKQEKIKDFKSAFLPLMIPVLIVCGLILPANFSTAAMLFLTSIVLMFIGRVSLKYIFSLMGIGAVSFILLMIIASANPDLIPRATTWKARIESFVDKDVADSDKTYQVDQSKIAIASGGIIGK